MLLDIALVAATLTCTLVAGLLLGFAVVAMPGLGTLGDRGFLRAFQAMDRIIQDRQPLFMLVWVGSVLTLVAALVLGLGQLDGAQRLLLVIATTVYVLGVQVPTVVVNVPLNNAVQTVDVDAAGTAEITAARERFEARWNRWNAIRTILACGTSLALLVLLLGR